MHSANFTSQVSIKAAISAISAAITQAFNQMSKAYANEKGVKQLFFLAIPASWELNSLYHISGSHPLGSPIRLLPFQM
jgi:hypothetical protein